MQLLLHAQVVTMAIKMKDVAGGSSFHFSYYFINLINVIPFQDKMFFI